MPLRSRERLKQCYKTPLLINSLMRLLPTTISTPPTTTTPTPLPAQLYLHSPSKYLYRHSDYHLCYHLHLYVCSYQFLQIPESVNQTNAYHTSNETHPTYLNHSTPPLLNSNAPPKPTSH